VSVSDCYHSTFLSHLTHTHARLLSPWLGPFSSNIMTLLHPPTLLSDHCSLSFCCLCGIAFLSPFVGHTSAHSSIRLKGPNAQSCPKVSCSSWVLTSLYCQPCPCPCVSQRPGSIKQRPHLSFIHLAAPVSTLPLEAPVSTWAKVLAAGCCVCRSCGVALSNKRHVQVNAVAF
jgi:hypothetical protein